MSNEHTTIKTRILSMVHPDQLPFAEFELRMLIATLESESLSYIHQYWRPIADERDQLKDQLAKASQRRAKPSEVAALVGTEDAAVRLEALSREHALLLQNHANLQTRCAALQKDLDELLASKP